MAKTVSSYFHLNDREAEDTLSIRSLNNQLPSDQFPTYLGVTLDRSLSYKKHTGNVMQKLKKRTNLIRKISGTSWGAPHAVLRTSAMALCYSVAEYETPAWTRSWALSNRLRSGQGRTACNLHRWGYAETPLCPECQLEPQDTDHFVLHCPVTAIPGGYETERNEWYFFNMEH